MDQLAIEIGSRIKQARGDLGLTQEDVAKRLKIGRAAYSNIENGHSLVTVEHLLNISRLFRRPVDYFLGIQGTQKADEIEMLELYRITPPGPSRRAILGFLREWAQASRSEKPPAIQETPVIYRVASGPVIPTPTPGDILDDLEALDSVELQTVQDFIRWRRYEQDRRRNSFNRKRQPAEDEGFFIPPAFEGADLTPEQIEELKAVHHRLAAYIKSISPAEREALLNETAAIQLELIERSPHPVEPDQPDETGDPASEDRTAINSH